MAPLAFECRDDYNFSWPSVSVMNRVLLALIVCCAWSCNYKPERPERSFYYWKTTSDWARDSALLLLVDHFYVRYLDVDWSESHHMPVPVGVLDYKSYFPFDTLPVTPVIYITNRTFDRLPITEIDTLAGHIVAKMEEINYGLKNNWTNVMAEKVAPPTDGYYHATDSLRRAIEKQYNALRNEVQIDSDWTVGTRDAYFLFLRKLRAKLPGKQLSATIRLFPYKYRKKMGVPPIDRGMLMCYNLGRIGSVETSNSVFDIEQLKTYLDAADYPLPLDYCLPVFGWAVWFRGGQLKGILHEANTTAWTKKYGFKKMDATHYIATRDEVQDGNYFREGDELRMEYPDPEALKKAADLLGRKIPGRQRVAFYHWDKESNEHYEAVIKSVFKP